MTEKTAPTDKKEKNTGELIRDSLTIIVTLIFILLYAAAYTGKFDPLRDNTFLLHLEPVIFILIGYGFARLPARQNEKSLKEEISRLTQKNAAAAFAKEKSQLDCEKLEEKIRNARAALKQIAKTQPGGQSQGQIEAFKMAVGILDS